VGGREGGRDDEAAKLAAQTQWLDETVIEIIISEAQNEVADFKKWASTSSRTGR
jgi:hypothetical protein